MTALAWFRLLSVVGWALVVAFVAVRRNRLFATFSGVILGIHTLSAIAIASALQRVLPVLAYLQVVALLHFAILSKPRMRGLLYRATISLPASFFIAGSFLALPWSISAALGFTPWAPWVPFALAALGMIQSLTSRETEIDLSLGGEPFSDLQPIPHGDAREDRPLRIVQITDPHLGPFMSVERLQRICARAVARNPDLIVLTGDLLTMESQSDPELLARALSPLKALPGRVFACHGNHDHEAPHIVADACAKNGVHLLIDEAVDVETEAGPVQIVGMDYVWSDRARHMREVCAEHPRKPGRTRIVLLHDPGAFKHLPEGEGDLVLSGHTHGGQVGLISLGSSWTFLRLFGRSIPDHGFWARGLDRLYVHRGTGHYGFPLRLGVPAEQSLLRVHRAS